MRLRSVRWIRLFLVPVALGCATDAELPTTASPAAGVASRAADVALWRAITAGGSHTCGVAPDKRAYCWGLNFSGQVGDGTTTSRPAPVAVAGGPRFRHLIAGGGHTCGLTSDHRAFCWGSNEAGQLGDGTSTDRSTPGEVAGGHRFHRLSAGSGHTCGLTPSHGAYCWGLGISGQLGDGSTGTNSLTPVRVAGDLRFHHLTAGAGHTCALTKDGVAYCWGNNGAGQLGNDETGVDRPAPVAVLGDLRFRQLTASGFNTCGLTTAGAAYCWGQNSQGQVGDGTAIERAVPVAVAGGIRFRELDAGASHTCGVASGGRAYCWGQNWFGQLGNGQSGFPLVSLQPASVSGGLRFTAVSTGDLHTCAVASGGVAYCWGQGLDGQLGNGAASPGSPTPVAVSAPAASSALRH